MCFKARLSFALDFPFRMGKNKFDTNEIQSSRGCFCLIAWGLFKNYVVECLRYSFFIMNKFMLCIQSWASL